MFPMAGHMPQALYPLLGRDLDAVGETELTRLVGASETEWFDAKRDLYGRSDRDKRELASDVAAFANRQGGLIVIGLDETGEVVSALTPTPDESLVGEELRMTQIISSLVAPVPAFSVRRVTISGGGSCLLLSVPPSVRRPHCVAVGSDTVRYPLREGTHKRYLSESEIADLYRSRFAEARAHTDRANVRHKAMVASLDGSEQAWLVISVEPESSGAFAVSRASMEPLRAFGKTTPVQFPTWFRGTSYTPVRAFRAIHLLDAHDRVYSSAAHLHLDGGGSMAFGWEWRPRNGLDTGPKVALIADEDIVGCLVNAVWSLAHWATNWAGASGDATLLVELYAPETYPMALWQYRGSFPDRLRGSRELGEPSGLVEITVALDATVTDSADLLVTCRRAASELESAFGVFGPSQITVDGGLRWRYFYRDKTNWLRQWAAALGVEVLDDADE